MAANIFISHSHKDKDFVRHLSKSLIAHGLNVWIDEAELAIGDSLVEQISKAVEAADYLLVVMSPHYFKSQWTKHELDMALHSEVSEKNRVRVVPILLQDCEIPPLLAGKMYADFRTQDAAERVFPQLLSLLKDQPIELTAQTEDVYFGQRSKATTGDPDLEEKFEELKKRVETFMGKAPEPEVDNITMEVDPKLCFIVMPFESDDLNDVYEYFVKPAIEENSTLVCERGDDLFGSNPVMDDIRRSIERARLIIADLTDRNPNVFYEVGIAHTLNKDVLLLSQSMSDVPFDLRHLRVLNYECTPKGCRILERKLADNVAAILNGD